jgi:hypothetical protein
LQTKATQINGFLSFCQQKATQINCILFCRAAKDFKKQLNGDPSEVESN